MVEVAEATPRRDRAWIKAIAWVLMFAASLFNLLNFNNYPLFRVEVALVFCFLAVIGLALVLLEVAAARLAFAFTALLVLVGADLNTESNVIPPLLGLAALAAAWFNNAAVVRICIAAFGAVVVFQIGTGAIGSTSSIVTEQHPSRQAASTTSLPPLIHLLMDSYVGTEGMSVDPEYDSIREDTLRFYTDRGFQLYDGAYSRHANTANSIPYILSFGNAKFTEESQVVKRKVPDRLQYFDALRSDGYAITVLGSNFVDLCTRQPIAECRQFEHSELSAITKFPMTTRDRAVSIGVTLASFSSAASNSYDMWQMVKWYFGGKTPVVMRNLKKIAPPKTAVIMKDLAHSFENVKYNNAYFSHLLLPHEPYVFDAECNILPRSTWTNEQVPGSHSERNADYRAQLACTHILLGKMLDALEKSEAGRNAIVIIHGDHGSRIVRQRPTVEQPSPDVRDFAMTYSTLFAIKANGLSPGIVHGRAALEDLLEDFVARDFREAPVPEGGNGEVVLATMEWIPKERIPLPEY